MSTPLPVPGNGIPVAHNVEVPDFQDEPGEILQEVEDDSLHTIPVTVVDPVRSQSLPARTGGFNQYALTTTAAICILPRDPRRKRAVITLFDTAGTSDGAQLGGTQAEALSAYAALLPLPGPGIASGNVVFGPVELTTMDEVWACASGAACTMSVVNEQWAN